MKYIITENEKTIGIETVRQIRATKTFSIFPASGEDEIVVQKGDLGGWVRNEQSLSQNGSCWVFPGAVVLSHAAINGDAFMEGETILDDSKMEGQARLSDRAIVHCKSVLSGAAWVKDQAQVGSSTIEGRAIIAERAQVWRSHVGGDAALEGCVDVSKSLILGNTFITGAALVADMELYQTPARVYIPGQREVAIADLDHVASYVADVIPKKVA